MGWNEFLGSLLFLGMTVAVALIVFFVLRSPTSRLLSMNSRLAETRPFFLRVLFVVLILSALSISAGKMFNLPSGSAFMEYVWQAAGSLNGTVGLSAVVVGSFAVIVTVLLLGLGRYRDE